MPVIFRSDCDAVPKPFVWMKFSECQSFLGQTATNTFVKAVKPIFLGVPVIFRSDCDVNGRLERRFVCLGVPVIFRSDCDFTRESGQIPFVLGVPVIFRSDCDLIGIAFLVFFSRSASHF